MTLYKNITTQKIEKAPLTIKRMIKDKDGNDKEVITITNDEALILAAGYEKYTPAPRPQPTLHERLQHMRFSKRKIKATLVELGLWDAVKASLTQDEYEDLMLSMDFAFGDPLFDRVYTQLSSQIQNIDEKLLLCRL